MCLKITRDSKELTAETDIKCYKFLLKYNENGLMTPFQSAKVKIGGRYKSKLINSNNTIEIGLHSFVNSFDCEFYQIGLKNSEVVECIIPKGSKYYIGTFKGYASYASSEIIYESIVK